VEAEDSARKPCARAGGCALADVKKKEHLHNNHILQSETSAAAEAAEEAEEVAVAMV